MKLEARACHPQVVRLDCRSRGHCAFLGMGSGDVARRRHRKPRLGGVVNPHELVDAILRGCIDALRIQARNADVEVRWPWVALDADRSFGQSFDCIPVQDFDAGVLGPQAHSDRASETIHVDASILAQPTEKQRPQAGPDRER